MTENEIVVMLSEAIELDRKYKSWHVSTNHLVIFARMIAQVEREECAKIVDKWSVGMSSEPEMVEIANEIRARK